MQRTSLALMLTLTGCMESTQGPSTAATTDTDAAEASAATAAREGFTQADDAVPPPPVGTTLPLLRITRPDRTTDDLRFRLTAVLYVMGLEVDQSAVSTWASVAANAGEPDVTALTSSVVVVYDPELDDLMIVNTRLLDMQTRTPDVSTDALLSVAADVVAGLVAAEVVDSSVSIDQADTAIIRSGSGGSNGEHEEWVDEVLFDLGARVEGIDLADARLRIGLTPAGEVSSVQVTSVHAEHAGRVTIARSIDDIEDAFADYVAATTPSAETVYVDARLPAYVLYQNASTSLVEPRYLVIYSADVRSGNTTMVTRSRITAWGLTDPTPPVEVWP